MFHNSTKFVTSDSAMGTTRSSRCSLWDVLWLASRSEVWSDLSLILGVNCENTSLVLNSLLSSADDGLLELLLFFDLWSLVSDLTITGH